MFKNYFLVALRNFKRQKVYSLINIVGLAIGMAICVLIWHFISYEKSYDNFHENGENLCRLEASIYQEGKLVAINSKAPPALGPALKEDFPEVLEYARLFTYNDAVVTYRDTSARVENMFMADASFPEMLSLDMIRGNPKTALTQPSSAVISESAAKKFFGNEDPVEKVIKIDRIDHREFTIKGIFKDMPHNSHLQFDLLFSIHQTLDLDYFKSAPWGRSNLFTYVLLHPGTNPKALQAKIPGFLNRYLGKALEKYKMKVLYTLMPLQDIYLHSPDPGYKIKNRDYNIIYFSALLSIFILLIAWFNYINLATARSLTRSKEVGLRKVSGATRGQLIKQFLFESAFFNICGAVLALLIVLFSIPFFNRFFGLPPHVSLLSRPLFWPALTAGLIAGSFLSGMYPAFVLSSFKPIAVLQCKLKKYSMGDTARKSLVVFQLIISLFLVTGMITVYNQLDFMRNRDLGINKENVLLVRAPIVIANIPNPLQKFETFSKEIRQAPVIDSFTLGRVPGRDYGSATYITLDGGAKYKVRRIWMDPDYLKTFQIELLAGRDLSQQISTDQTDAALLNETAVELLNFKSPAEAVDKYIIDTDGRKKLKIIGVIKDFHQCSLKEKIEPLILRHYNHYGPSYFSFRVKPGYSRDARTFVKEKWDEFLPGNPFEYTFLDEFYDMQYKGDMQFSDIFKVFSFLVVFISCIGLSGMFAYSTLQRAKEISIRKVLGAEVLGILILLLKDLMKIFLVSLCITFPVAYFVFSKWLENYAYRLEIGWWFFVLPVIIIIPVIFISVVYHVLKASLANPVDSLRN